jgi:LacI family transcriptional regulator, repressor for deo operon, udp, cdd, tsx, nupC, and nupG
VAASIGDVAARAGVSVATVSRALRGLPNVAPSTRARVLEAAAALEYVADPHASRLAAGRTQTIGVVLPFISQWFFTQVVSGAEAVLAAAGYDVLLYNVGGAAGRERFLRQLPFRKRVDGLLVVELPLSEREQHTLAGAGTPVATVGLAPSIFPGVTIDNVAAGVAATRHLVNLGHEEIGLIANLPDDPLHFPAPIERRRGYRAALADGGLHPRPELDVPGNFSLQGGAEAMAQLLAVRTPPTAVVAESDEMAIGALKTVRDAGLRVPEDVSVIGIDDHDMAHFVGLTTVAQPVVQQGEVAAELLLRELAGDGGRAGGDGPPRVVLPTKLVVRSTTGPPRRRRRSRGRALKPLATPAAAKDDSPASTRE